MKTTRPAKRPCARHNDLAPDTKTLRSGRRWPRGVLVATSPQGARSLSRAQGLCQKQTKAVIT